jgi:hypothetical protein
MDTSKILRAKLRDALKKWHDAALKGRALADERHRQSHDLHRGDAAQIMAADRSRRIGVWLTLANLAGDEEIGALVMQLDERRPLKLVGSIAPPENPHLLAPDSLPPCEWTIARPGRESPLLPQTIHDPLVVWEIVVEAVVPEWIDWLADETEPAPMQGEPVLDMKLGKKARAVLKLLVGERAFDESKAIKLAKVAPTKLKCGQAKTASTRVKYAEEGSEELRERGLAQAVQSVGTWLTPKGKTEAERLFGK